MKPPSDQELTRDTRARVIQATIDLITSEKESFQSISIRKIAKAARVNLAAVNYHFGSRANVLDEVLQVFLTRLISGLSPQKKKVSTKARLQEFLRNYLTFSFSNRKFVREMMVHVVLKGDDSNETLKRLLRDNGYEPLRALLAQMKPRMNPLELQFLIILTISGILFPVLEAGFIRHVVGVDFEDTRLVEKYTQFLLENTLGRKDGRHSALHSQSAGGIDP